MQTRTGYFATAATLMLGLSLAGPALAAERKVGQTPEPGVVTTVSIGSTLLERYNVIVDPGVILSKDVDVDLGMQGSIRISAGSPMMIEQLPSLRPARRTRCAAAACRSFSVFLCNLCCAGRF